MKKRINLTKISIFTLLITISALILVAGTYAKYTSSASGTDATVVANWSFTVNGTDIAVKGSAPTINFNLFETINDITTGEKETNVADGLIAPGTTGDFEFKLHNSSDVTTKYAINLSIDNTSIPLEFSLGDDAWVSITNLEDLVATDIMSIDSKKDVTVQWRWVFDGITDASLSGQTVKVTANITATQVDNSDINTEQDTTVSNFDFGWTQGIIDSSGALSTLGSTTLNNYYSDILYFEKLELNLLSDNIMFKIVEYDANGNFISSGAWQSKKQTQWTDGGTDSITIENKYVRIAIADTTINNSQVYTITPSEYSDRYSYSIEGTTYRIGIEYKLLAVETIALPDINYGETGKGFTITGLTYSASDNTYYAGNYGKVYTSDTTVNNTIVHLSSDLKTNLGEIELPNISEVQGVTVDSSDNTLWYVSPPDKKMYHISTTGEELGEVNLGTNVTGIAYDSRTDTLWVLDSTKLINVEKNGTVKTTITLDISNVDQIYLDETDNSIYITAGNNYQGDSYVYKVNLSTQKSKLLYTLEDSHAIEGIHIKDGKMYIGNDGVYHEAKIESNIIQVYTIK